MTRIGTVAALAAALAGGLAAQASADPVGTAPNAVFDGRSFGQHVAGCAQAGELTGDHNPGMHAGITGWMTDMPM